MSRSGGAIGVVGLGLMGGSLARALKSRDPSRPLIGVEPDAGTRERATADDIADLLLPTPAPALAECEIVVLCAPVAEILELLAPVSRQMAEGSVLTDIGGVKEPILAASRSKVLRGVAFVGAHPIFGGEQGGYAAARADLWKGGAVAVCGDGAPERAVERVAELHRGLGAEVVLCSAAEHDRAVAGVSHLPYLLASALALTTSEAGPIARKLAGKALADMTRLAAFAYEVQGEAARRNTYLPAAAERLGQDLRILLEALARSPEAAREALSRAREAERSLP